MAATEEDNHLFLREQCSFMTGQDRQPTLKIWKQLLKKVLWVRVQHICQASEEQTPPHSSPWPKTTKQMPLTHAGNQIVSGWSEGKSFLHSTMEIKFQFFITTIPILSRLNLISQYLPTPQSSPAQMGVSWDKLRQRPWRDTAWAMHWQACLHHLKNPWKYVKQLPFLVAAHVCRLHRRSSDGTCAAALGLQCAVLCFACGLFLFIRHCWELNQDMRGKCLELDAKPYKQPLNLISNIKFFLLNILVWLLTGCLFGWSSPVFTAEERQ